MPWVVVDAPTLLARLAETLRAEVGPAVADSYARAQVDAAVALLENLAAHVDWAPGLVESQLAAVAEAAAALGAAAEPALADEGPLAELVRRRQDFADLVGGSPPGQSLSAAVRVLAAHSNPGGDPVVVVPLDGPRT